MSNCMLRQSVITIISILGGCRVCPTSEVSPPVMVIVQSLTDVTLPDTFRRHGASRI